MRKVNSLVLLAGCAVLLYGRQEVTRDFQKSLPLPPGHGVRIEHSQGNVTIHTQARATLEIHSSIKCSADQADDAHNWCDQIKVVVEESSSGVLVRTDYPHLEGRHNLSYSVNYDITMPETAPLEVRDRFGAISVTNPHGGATINNSNGQVVVSGGHGRLRIETSFGDVQVGGNDGDLSVVDTNGKVTVSDITGTLDVRDSFGDVRVTNAANRVGIDSGNSPVSVSNAGGTVRITASFGPVVVHDAHADVTVENQNGRVEAMGVIGTADLRTSFEAIRFSRIGKELTVRASNSRVTGDTVGGSAAVETSFGAIELRGVKGNARATAANSEIRLVDIGGEAYARTSFGGTSVENVAGPITVESENGSVTVRPGRAPTINLGDALRETARRQQALAAAQREGQPLTAEQRYALEQQRRDAEKLGRQSQQGAATCQPISVRTTFAPIRVSLPRGMGYDVTARTSFGRIASQPPITVSGEMGGDSLTGKIANGGCALNLIDQSGSIDILW
jgi:hypothetical protein